MENINSKKYIIISLIVLFVLLCVYGIVLLIGNQNRFVGNNTPTPTITLDLDRIPTSTLAPLNPLPTNIDITQAQNYSPIDQPFLDKMKQDEILDRPDVTVSNATPFNNEYFLATTEFVKANPTGYYKVVIYPNSVDEALVDEEVEKWLRSLNLPTESIGKLVIEHRSIAAPIPEN